MFEGLIHDAKSAADAVAAKIAARVLVAVPLILALGFATAGTTIWLAEQFGTRSALFIVAAGFAAIGLIAVVIVIIQERKMARAAGQAAATLRSETAKSATATAVAAAEQVPMALISGLLGTELGAASAKKLTHMVERNLPLLILLAAVALLLWPKKTEEPAVGEMSGTGTEPPPQGEGDASALAGGY